MLDQHLAVPDAVLIEKGTLRVQTRQAHQGQGSRSMEGGREGGREHQLRQVRRRLRLGSISRGLT